MVRTKHQSPTEFTYPVGRICGKISRHLKVVHACTASGKQITYLQGERDLNAHPVSADEKARMALFKKRAKAVSLRTNKKSSTYEADLAAYRAQLDNEGAHTTFQSYIWSLVMAEITE